MMKNDARICVLCLFLICLAVSSCSINKPILKPIDTVFKEVPEDFRHELWVRMKRLEEYRKTNDWENYFDLLDKEYVLSGEYRPKTREEYIEWQKEISKDDDFFEFIPLSASYEENGYWWINGCVGYGKRIIKYYEAITFAKYENAEWYFVDFYSVLGGMDSPAVQCGELWNE